MSFYEDRACSPIKAWHPTSGLLIDVDFQKDARINPHNIAQELARLPGTFSWYAQLRDIAETHLKEARHIEHNIEEDWYRRIIKQHIEAGGKRPTETEIKMAIKGKRSMRDAFRTRMEAEDIYRKLKTAVEAIEYKKWALQALAKVQMVDRSMPDSA